MKYIAKLVFLLSLAAFCLAACNSSPTEPIFATVGKEQITQKAYEETVRQFRFTLINQYRQAIQELAKVADQPALQEQLSNRLDEIATALDPAIVGKNVLNSMVNNLLIRQEAKRRGITVSKDELDIYIHNKFGLYAGDVQVGATAAPISTLNPTQVALELQVVQSTLAPAPTPTSISESDFRLAYTNYIQQIKIDANVSESTVQYFFESSLYREKIEAAIVSEAKIQQVQEQVWARHILVADEASANEVVNRLKAGEGFSELARKWSVDTSTAYNGGDLGWFVRGETLPEFETAAFNLEIGQISAPVKTANGYHIIQVLGHETKPIDQRQYQNIVQGIMKDWLAAAWEKGSVKIREDWQAVVPVVPAFTPIPLP